ncbi:MAG TPA: hypothetical protein VMT87_12230 [Vicinamibacteria bacterium]|nr:hypothetical protein [Vicinamibacteria bacterium]
MTRGAAVLLALLVLAAPAAAEESHLVIVVGLGGEKKYTDAFHEMAVSMVGAAEKKLGIDPARIVYLGEKPADPALPVYRGRSSRETVGKALADVARRARRGDLVFILLIGHGSAQAGESRFNLAGPDMGAADFAPLLDALAAQTVVFVNAASASGDFVKVLAGKDRAVVTATKSALERNQTVFARHFVDAFAGEGADADKDQRVSLLEAFEYARREVQRFYEKERRLLTEHAVLEDGRKGALARRVFLGTGGEAVTAAEASDPALAGLRQERREVERRLEAFRGKKAALPADEYEAQLEGLLLELALKDEAIRRRAAEARP